MSPLNKKKILVGVTGGIAAYKSADLVRLLVKEGAMVRVVMTQAATRFVAPLTFEALSTNPVSSEMHPGSGRSAMEHIELARWADALLIAPASADFIARQAHGFANDLLSIVCLATRAPIMLAPAMNRQMWLAQATRDNISLLTGRGVEFAGPGEGIQACGESGPGRMLEPAEIIDHLEKLFGSKELSGRTILITAGPTREGLDPVRFISNRSSGKMGYAIAETAHRAGAKVTMVSGPVALEPPAGVERYRVLTAEQMHERVMELVERHEIFIATAAVADYRPKNYSGGKMKKSVDNLTLELVPTLDILADVAALENRPFCVGFAAETDDLDQNATSKLKAKSLDLLAANQVGESGPGFESDENALTLYWPGGSRELPLAPKHALARQLVTVIGERYDAQGRA